MKNKIQFSISTRPILAILLSPLLAFSVDVPSAIQSNEVSEIQSPTNQSIVNSSALIDGEAKLVGDSESDFDSFLLGDWGHFRSTLIDNGFEFELGYIGELSYPLVGGVQRELALLGQLAIVANFDLGSKLDLSGWKINTVTHWDHGDSPGEIVGDRLVSSNLDSADAFKLYEAYVSKSFGERFELKAGLRDLNAEFYATDSSAVFRNSDFGIGASLSQTGENGPSIFPTTALALTSRFDSEDHYYFQSGIFNAVAGKPGESGTYVNTDFRDGYLMIWETGFQHEESTNLKKLAVGYWTYTKTLSPIAESGSDIINNGVYLLLDSTIHQNLRGFTRFGWANPLANELAASLDLGLNLSEPFSGRKNDVVGLAWRWRLRPMPVNHSA